MGYGYINFNICDVVYMKDSPTTLPRTV